MQNRVLTPLAAARPEPLDLVWEASGIANVLGCSVRRAYQILESGLKKEDGTPVPGAKKIAGKWCLHVPTFLASFEQN